MSLFTSGDRETMGPEDAAHHSASRRYRGLIRVALPVLVVACVLVRLGLIDRQGLWADELFSLAMATGHSLEHPADRADPALGDFVELSQPSPPAVYSRYLEHESPPASPARVVRAVLLSDTSPPLYYLVLSGWTRLVGTGDVMLRLFSFTWALACFPLMWLLARQVGGPSASIPTCFLFTFSPLSVFYSTEGRMYSLLWFCALGLMGLTLRLWRRGFSPWSYAGWVAAGTAGLLTHYFFAFVWAAALAWLAIHPGRFPRRSQWTGVVLTALLILPWYVRLPESLSSWRVTAYWLKLRPADYNFVVTALTLPWKFLSIRGVWGIRPRLDWINGVIYLAAAMLIWKRLSWSLFSPRRALLWLWMLGTCLGLVTFDLLRGTYVMAVPRYSAAGMPAALLLVGLGLGRLRPPSRVALLALILLVDSAGILKIYLNTSRNYSPFRELGRHLAHWVDRDDLVLVHSIPSGVVGVARYMQTHGAPTEGFEFASWVGQLKQRHVPDDLKSLAAGRRRVILVKIHEVNEPAPQEVWLRAHARLVGEQRFEAATVLEFVPRDADRFAHESPVRQPQGGPVDSIADRSICDMVPVSIISRAHHWPRGRSRPGGGLGDGAGHHEWVRRYDGTIALRSHASGHRDDYIY